MDRLLFGLLGPTTVIGDAGEIPVQGTIRRRLLARLLVAGGRPVSIARLEEDLWDGFPPASASSTLKSHVSLLRRSLGRGRLDSRGGGYILHVEPDELDVSLFETDAQAGADLLRRGEVRLAAEAFATGLARWRGRALADVAGCSWAQPEAVRIEEVRAFALDCWLEARLALGETHQIVAPAEAAIAEHPLSERLWAKLMTALYRSGRQADALRAYQRLRLLLAEELGIEPSVELVELETAILRQQPALTAAAKDASREHAGNLPGDVTSFVGRGRELSELAILLERPGLVTLVGPGGTGKTRLAIQAARAASAGLDAVWLCELAAVAEPADTARELGLVLGCADSVGTDLTDLIGRRLSTGRQLLILDNCEHLLDESAALATRLRRAAPELRVVVTSRAPLEAEGESVYRVYPMSVPGDPPTGKDRLRVGGSEHDELLDYESVRLFVERAALQQRSFSLDPETSPAVVAICRRLDGIPLAIELAAARLRTLSVTDIERRLDDRFRLLSSGARTAPERQRTLRSLLDWSYDLLSGPEQSLFARLAVFAASFDIDAAEAVAGDLADSAADLLASLVDKSLIQFDLSGGPSRYRMLETIREYSLGRVRPEDELEARRAHARHFLDLAIRAMPQLAGVDHLTWRSRLEHDDENLRAAFVTTLSEARPDRLLEFAAALCRYWISRGGYGDEMALIETALDREGVMEATAVRGDALAAAAFMYFRRGETARAQARADEALAIARDLGLPALAADALRTSAWVADRRGDSGAALERASEAVGAALSSGRTDLVARAFDVRGAAGQMVDVAQARVDYTESLRYSRMAGDVAAQASTLNNLAILELEGGDHRAAKERFDEAIAIADGMSDPALMPFIRYGMGLASLLDRDFEPAKGALGEALKEARRTGQRSLEAYALLAIAVAQVHTNPDRGAAQLLGAAQAMFEQLGERPEPTEAALFAQALQLLTSALGDSLEPVIASGRALQDPDVMRLAGEPCPSVAGVIE